jgi:rubrerythrin
MMEMKSASEFLVLLSKITGAEMKYPCPGCGYLVFDEPPGSYEICPICFWEDDLAQLRFHGCLGVPTA